MANKLYVIARIQAKPDAVETLRGILSTLQAATRQEPGCISYRILQSDVDATEFTSVEEWVDDAAEAAHMTMPHVQQCFALVPALLAAAPELRRYRGVD